MTKLSKLLLTFVALIFLAGVTASCSDDKDNGNAGGNSGNGEAKITVSNAEIPVAAGANTALYFEVTNSGTKADSLIDAKADIAQMVEVHRSFQDDEGMMKMEHQPEVEIGAGETVVFEPGDYHVMLMGVDELTEGDKVSIDLVFKDSGTITVEATVITYADVAH